MPRIKSFSLTLLWGITLALLFSISFNSTLSAQDQAPQFKVGDRVEADINMSSSPQYSKWRKATITKVEMWQGQVAGYSVKTDEGGEYVLGARHMRPLTEAEKKDEPTANEAAKQKPATRKSTSRQKSGSSTASQQNSLASKHRAKGCPLGPSREHYQGMLRTRWQSIHEHEYEKIKVIFDSFQILKPRKWTNPYGRAVNTTVHPVKTKYKVDLTHSSQTFYKHKVMAYDSLIYFYKDTRGECTFDVVQGAQGKTLVYEVR